jgi:DNA-binding transcriptional LysR family regulator
MNKTKLNLAALSVQQMRTFCAVYESGGYAGAEEVVGLSVPTMWEQIRVLEKLYANKLFQRSGRSIKPTHAGVVLYQLLVPLLASIESTLEIISEESDLGSNVIRVVAGTRMMMEELGKPFRAFQQKFPAIRLRIMTADSYAAQQYILDGVADVALFIEPPPGVLAEPITCERLYPIDYLAAFPLRHPLLKKSQLSIVDVVSQPLILGNPNTIGRQVFEQALFRLGLSRPQTISAETDNSAVTLACVRAGLGVGILAGRSDGYLTEHVAVRSLSGEMGRVFVVAAMRRGRQLTKSLNAFVQFLASSASGANAT